MSVAAEKMERGFRLVPAHDGVQDNKLRGYSNAELVSEYSVSDNPVIRALCDRLHRLDDNYVDHDDSHEDELEDLREEHQKFIDGMKDDVTKALNACMHTPTEARESLDHLIQEYDLNGVKL